MIKAPDGRGGSLPLCCLLLGWDSPVSHGTVDVDEGSHCSTGLWEGFDWRCITEPIASGSARAVLEGETDCDLKMSRSGNPSCPSLICCCD